MPPRRNGRNADMMANMPPDAMGGMDASMMNMMASADAMGKNMNADMMSAYACRRNGRHEC